MYCRRVVITAKRRQNIREVGQRLGEVGAVPVGQDGGQFPADGDGFLGGVFL